MKKIFLTTSLTVAALVFVIVSCNKEVEGRTDNVAALNPTNIDLNAGTWKPVLLTGPSEFAVTAPIATNTPDYIAQINEIKAYQANLTSDEKRIVQYWSAGAVLRWNEILRELVAKHNIPPYQTMMAVIPFPMLIIHWRILRFRFLIRRMRQGLMGM